MTEPQVFLELTASSIHCRLVVGISVSLALELSNLSIMCDRANQILRGTLVTQTVASAIDVSVRGSGNKMHLDLPDVSHIRLVMKKQNGPKVEL